MEITFKIIVAIMVILLLLTITILMINTGRLNEKHTKEEKELYNKKEYLLQLLGTLEEEVFGAIDTAYKRDEDNFVHNCDTVKDLFKVLYTDIDELGEEE